MRNSVLKLIFAIAFFGAVLAQAEIYAVMGGQIKELNDELIKSISPFPVRGILHEIKAEIQALQPVRESYVDTKAKVLVFDDIAFKIIKIKDYRFGTVFIGLQLSRRNGGQLRLASYIDIPAYAKQAGSGMGRIPAMKDVNEALVEVLGPKNHDKLVGEAKKLLENYPKKYRPDIGKTLEDMISESEAI